MKLLTMDDASKVCAAAGVAFSTGVPGFQGLPKIHVQVTPPNEYSRLVVFTDALWSLLYNEAGEFLLWVIDDDVWSEKATTSLFNQVRSGVAGCPSDLNTAPAQMLEYKDRDANYSLFLLCLLGRWDALLVALSGQFFFSISHHQKIEIHCRDRSLLDSIVAHLKSAGVRL